MTDTIMRLLKEEDPDGCEQRKRRRLKGRVYRNKVSFMATTKVFISNMIHY